MINSAFIHQTVLQTAHSAPVGRPLIHEFMASGRGGISEVTGSILYTPRLGLWGACSGKKPVPVEVEFRVHLMDIYETHVQEEVEQ